MPHRSQGSRRLLVACTLLLTSQLLLVSTPTSATSDDTACAELKRWAQVYEGATITLDDFAQFDRAHRIAIFNAVSPDVRAALVQDQLRRFRQRPDLSDTQRTLIAEALTLVTPALYRHELSAIEAHKEFVSRASLQFTSPGDRRPWVDLGAFVSIANHGASSASRDSIIPLTGLGLTCNCSIAEQSECPGQCSGGTGCTTTSVGCGWSGADSCTGRCQ